MFSYLDLDGGCQIWEFDPRGYFVSRNALEKSDFSTWGRPHRRGVYEIRILLRDSPKEFLRKCSEFDIEISDSKTQVERLNLGPW